MGFLISPFIAPFGFGFFVAKLNWRWIYHFGAVYSAIVVLLIAFCMEETMYDRGLPNPHPIPRPKSRVLYRVQTLIGVTGSRMDKYRTTWREVSFASIKIVWRPHLLGVLLFEGWLFGFSIGINATLPVFLGSPPPIGFGLSEVGIAAVYGTPIVALLVGQVLGRYLNDWVMQYSIKRNKGFFNAEARLWTCYVAMSMYICGFVFLGASLQSRRNLIGVILGWGFAEVAIMMNTVAVCAYCNDCFPNHQGEMSALIDLARVLGGSCVPFFQVPWATAHGALQTFGVEAAVVAGLFVLIVPALQLKGRYLRQRFAV